MGQRKNLLPRRRFLIFGAPVIDSEAIQEVVETLKSGWIGTGPKVARFEEMLRERTGARHAVAVSSCTAALHLSLVAAGIGKGHEVITSTMTFPATVNAIIHAGARPVLVDCDRTTQLIDIDAVRQAITPRTRAIMPVHLHGRVCDLDALIELCRRHRLLLIEDAAHAIEGEYRGRKIGSIGNMTCFSFYATKNVTTAEGGAVTTDDDELARRIRVYSHHGLSEDAWRRYSDTGFRHYDVEVPGYKYNMTDLQAAIGIHQLPHADIWLARREAIWRRYDTAFADLDVERPAPVPAHMRHARHLYTLQVEERDRFIDEMKRLGIGTGIHYEAVHLRSYYRRAFGYKPDDFPNATRISETTVSLPLSPHLTDEDIEDVIEAVHAILL
jgi:dTDP-4-amino-4,6-dideoxygalactose transaminase